MTRTFQTSKGPIQTSLSDFEAVNVCRNLYGDFARSLVSQYDQYQKSGRRPLSYNQLGWVHKLAVESLQRQAAPPPQPVPQLPSAPSGQFLPIVGMFVKAKQHLRYPKIRLQAGNIPLNLAMAGPRSRYYGSVMVTSGPARGGRWFGRITPEGDFIRADNCPGEVVDLLLFFAKDHLSGTKSYAQLTGSCCFCGLPLTDPRSLAVSYGPICAKNWGLPWGEANSVVAAPQAGEISSQENTPPETPAAVAQQPRGLSDMTDDELENHFTLMIQERDREDTRLAVEAKMRRDGSW